MNCYKCLLFIFLSICSLNRAAAAVVSIGLFTDIHVQRLFITSTSGEYELWSDGISKGIISPDNLLTIAVEGDNITTKNRETDYGTSHKIELKSRNNEATFRIETGDIYHKSGIFEDDFSIELRNGSLLLINHVELEKYVAAVVEAEVGVKTNAEFYKMQSLLCRTFYLSNKNKHAADGYKLCDRYHCQVYKNKCRKPIIYSSVLATKGMVLVDANNELILSVYHSNCGGETEPSERVWGSKRNYLRSIKDTFCLASKNAKWEKQIPIDDWRKYLRKNKITSEGALPDTNYCMSQEKREKFYSFNRQEISVNKIRNDWKLNSTFFNIEQKGNFIVISGRGYGHGVGVCQEGALMMAENGYSYTKILNHYYNGIKIVNRE